MAPGLARPARHARRGLGDVRDRRAVDDFRCADRPGADGDAPGPESLAAGRGQWLGVHRPQHALAVPDLHPLLRPRLPRTARQFLAGLAGRDHLQQRRLPGGKLSRRPQGRAQYANARRPLLGDERLPGVPDDHHRPATVAHCVLPVDQPDGLGGADDVPGGGGRPEQRPHRCHPGIQRQDLPHLRILSPSRRCCIT